MSTEMEPFKPVLAPRKQALVNRELKLLHDKHGALTAEMVLDAATAQDHPLHPFFEWDDARAGYRYRLNQARGMIVAARLVVHQKARAKERAARIEVRAYPSLGNGAGFGPRAAVLSDQEARLHLIRGKLAAIRAAVDKVVDVDELRSFRTEIIALIDGFTAKIGAE